SGVSWPSTSRNDSRRPPRTANATMTIPELSACVNVGSDSDSPACFSNSRNVRMRPKTLELFSGFRSYRLLHPDSVAAVASLDATATYSQSPSLWDGSVTVGLDAVGTV